MWGGKGAFLEKGIGIIYQREGVSGEGREVHSTERERTGPNSLKRSQQPETKDLNAGKP